MVHISATRSNNWVAFGAAALALLLVVVTIFVEWGAFDSEAEFSGFQGMGGGTMSDSQAYGLLSIDDTSWFDNDIDGEDGVSQVRTGIVLYLVGAVVALGGVAVLAVPPRLLSRSTIAGAGLCLAGAVTAGLGALLHHLGALEIADANTASGFGASSTVTLALGVGLIMAYVGAAVLLAASVIGLSWNPAAPGDATTA